MSEEKEIIYESQCQLCEEHRTDLGTLISLKKSICGNDFPEDWQLELLKLMYEQYKLDRRTEKIGEQRKATTAQIQDYKKANIKEIRKELK